MQPLQNPSLCSSTQQTTLFPIHIIELNENSSLDFFPVGRFCFSVLGKECIDGEIRLNTADMYTEKNTCLAKVVHL
jgi:hypothetical protein